MKNENKLMGTGLLTALTASLCCITPVLALIAGTSGLASTFSWIEPFRPYMIGLTIVVLGFAWHQKLKRKTKLTQAEIDCACDTDEKPRFMQSKMFLGIVTVFALVMLAFPYYAGVFFQDNKKETVIINQSVVKTLEFNITGMTCASCEEHVSHEVNKLNGITSSLVSYKNGSALIAFDSTLTNQMEIEEAIANTGYEVIHKK
ncbi:MAG: mercuric ion transport protein [Flavobacteriales bacterium]|jgi:mercuric ion transport protein